MPTNKQLAARLGIADPNRPLTIKEIKDNRLKDGSRGTDVAANSRTQGKLTLQDVWDARKATILAKKAAELEAFVDMHKEHGESLLKSKLLLITGVMSEMQTVDSDGNTVHDTKMLDTKRLKVLHDMIVAFEARGFGSAVQKTETTKNVNVLQDILNIAMEGEVVEEV